MINKFWLSYDPPSKIFDMELFVSRYDSLEKETKNKLKQISEM